MTKRTTLRAILVALALVVGASTANAAEERWECCVGITCNPKKDDITVTLTANDAEGSGTIKSGSIVRNTTFHAHGLTRMWSWGVGKIEFDNLIDTKPVISNAPFVFVVLPSGSGRYYDLRTKDKDGRAKLTEPYICKWGEDND